MKNIVTARLALRPIVMDDIDALHALWTDADVRRYLWDNAVIPRERAEEMVSAIVAAFERDGRGMWLIREQGSGTACGFCGFLPREEQDHAELIYGLSPAVWGRGYATESALAVTAHAFDVLRVAKIGAAADVPNAASVRVMERIGMRFVRRGTVNGIDLVFYEIERPSPA